MYFRKGRIITTFPPPFFSIIHEKAPATSPPPPMSATPARVGVSTSVMSPKYPKEAILSCRACACGIAERHIHHKIRYFFIIGALISVVLLNIGVYAQFTIWDREYILRHIRPQQSRPQSIYRVPPLAENGTVSSAQIKMTMPLKCKFLETLCVDGVDEGVFVRKLLGRISGDACGAQVIQVFGGFRQIVFFRICFRADQVHFARSEQLYIYQVGAAAAHIFHHYIRRFSVIFTLGVNGDIGREPYIIYRVKLICKFVRSRIINYGSFRIAKIAGACI